MKPLLLAHFTATSCIGRGLDALLAALRTARGGLVRCDFERASLDSWIGAVDGVDALPVRADLHDFECRNNRLAQIGLAQDDFAGHVERAIARHGAERVGVFIGTSTSGILETERAYQQRDPQSGALPAGFRYAETHNPYSPAAFVRAYFALRGPAMTISTACSSGAKVFASARRMLEAGLIDAAVVGGVDSLCLTTLYGFNSLELLSRQPCRPFDVDRDGISIGEAAAFALVERVPSTPVDDDAILLLGVGESSDAHHMSSPHPDGLGARIAMELALAAAGLDAAGIDYINLHGTATPSNDAAESRALAALFDGTPCSSTKGATGHTLGAAGALEAVIAALALRDQLLPAGVNTTHVDPALSLSSSYLLTSRNARVRAALSNSFGFGGSNCSLVLGRADRAQL